MVQSCLISVLLFLKSTEKYGFKLAHVTHYPNFQKNFNESFPCSPKLFILFLGKLKGKFLNNFKEISLKMPFWVIYRIVISSVLTIKKHVTCKFTLVFDHMAINFHVHRTYQIGSISLPDIAQVSWIRVFIIITNLWIFTTKFTCRKCLDETGSEDIIKMSPINKKTTNLQTNT